ncbi:hypothetical protein NUU61_002795 [Penicillium alfredii]|uniref:Pentatricopeptide repeat protein n=1 Tax=Penicillium alfredii TaxID=1506179 RepID=A0A9W9KHA3_9EURO|nr:uncharacterized protein NUU61_002795 [Penicillium alfredii]KAJ5105448.1 hypothetical protein NUU61_002795 [Penicillium alfredii]
MSDPNRSSSSPSLRNLPKQAWDELVFSRTQSMSSSNPSPSNASIRRLSRRPRPSVASIADAFVGSLVLASFCHEHSPHARGLSTISLGASENRLRRVRDKSVADRRELPPGRRLEYLGSMVHLSPSQRLVGEGFARPENTSMDEKNNFFGFWGNTAAGTDGDSTFDPTENAKHSSIPGSLHAIELGKRKFTELSRKGNSSSSKLLRSPWISPDDEAYISTSRLYQRTLGDNYDWTEAVKAVVPHEKVVKVPSTSRDAVESPSVAKLVETLWGPYEPSTQYLFRLYRDISSPGVAQLSKRSRGAMLRRFANPQNRRWVDARRYLALVEDMVTAGLPISRSLWASAIHLSGRASGPVLKRDLIRSIGLWQQMEHVAKVQADDVVFNILFDISIKAGQFTVADRLQEEMRRRGISFSRCGKVSKIYYHGLRKDVEGIRETFDDFVRSGELVDTVVLNCLNAAFLRAGDAQTAEQLYARMLEAQANAPHPSSNDPDSPIRPNLTSEFTAYRTRTRELGRLLKKSAALKERLPEYHRALQDSLPMAPDTRTFHVFLRHYAYQSGQLDSFMAVLRDMERTFSVPPRGIIYLFLFEGFALHGRRKKSWSAERLRLTWHAYLRALHDSRARLDGLYLHAPEMVWENPLAASVATDADTELPVTDAPDGLYMPLPSADTKTNPDFEGNSGNSPRTAMDSTTTHGFHHEQNHDIEENEYDQREEGEELDLDEIFNPESTPAHQAEPELDHLERRVENGVFIGRRMIVVILRAFGACCGPKEVLEVWLQLERLWHPHRRKAVDVLAVKEELDNQMSRNPPRM